MVVSSIPGRRTIGRLVLGWATVFGRAYLLATQANLASYPLWDGSVVMLCGWG